MGQQRRRRRAAHQRPRPQAPLGSREPRIVTDASSHFDPSAEVDRLVQRGIVAACQGPFVDLAQACVDLEVLDRHDLVDAAFVRHATRLVARLWEIGWAPLDVVHAVQHRYGRVVGDLAAAMVLADPTLDRPDRPDEWSQQLASLRARRRRRAASRDEFGKLMDRFEMVRMLRSVGPTAPVLMPPSQWGVPRPQGRPAPRTAAVDARVLERVRALLAKAESTTFEAEADAFMTKAQELMARHAIDVAMVQAAAASGERLADGVCARRIHIDDPYAKQKAILLAEVASVNDGRTVWSDEVGFATVMGFPVDLDLIELTFTSLLVQLGRAMTAAASADRARTRAPSFRRAFVLSYAERIGERLREARTQASAEAERQYGGALVPVQQARREAVSQRSAEWFPNTRPMRSRSVDADGWHAGRRAADHARLEPGLDQLRS